MKRCASSWSKTVSGLASFFLLAAASFRRSVEGEFVERSVFAALYVTPCMSVGLGWLPFGMGLAVCNHIRSESGACGVGWTLKTAFRQSANEEVGM